jgi:hypothetical protein
MLRKKLYFSLILIITLQFTFSRNAFAYLDPGMGSFVFQSVVAIFIGGLFSIKIFWRKIKTFFAKHFSKKYDINS